MPIILTLDRVLLKNNITLSQLSKEINVSIVNLSILKTGKARAIRFSTLELICKALNCQPGDILKYEPDHKD